MWESVISGLVTGIITGLITGFFVTICYREKDAKIESSKFLHEISQYLDSLINYLDQIQVELTDNEVYFLNDFVYKNPAPLKYKWIKFTGKEEKEVDDALKECEEMHQMLLQCKIRIDQMKTPDYSNEKKKEFQTKIDELKYEILMKKDVLILKKLDIDEFNKKYISRKYLKKLEKQA